MRERRYAPLGATTALDTRVTAIEAASYLPLTGGTLSGALTVNAALTVSYTGDVDFNLGATGALEITGSSYQLNPTGIRIGQYTTTLGYIQAPANGSVAIWADGTQEIARFDDDLSAHIPGGTLQLGVYASTVGGVLKINGTTANKQAELICTNGNLHIDANDGQYIYLNYYSNTAGTYVSANGGFASTTQQTGQYGSVQTIGTKGGYGGISLAGNFALMNSGSAHVGLYDDVNNEWMFLAYPNSYIQLYYNGTVALKTQQYNATGATSSALVYDTGNNAHPVGFNDLRQQHANTSITLDAADCGQCFIKTTSTARTVTLPGSGSLDFPVYGVHTIINAATSGNITVNASTNSATLYWMDGSTQQGGASTNRTVGPGGVVTVRRQSSTVWHIWGGGIS